MNDVQAWLAAVDRRIADHEALVRECDAVGTAYKQTQEAIARNEEATAIYIEAIRLSREKTIGFLEKTNTDVLAFLFNDPSAKFVIDCVERRGLEADYLVEVQKAGMTLRQEPHNFEGGSVSDAVSTALKMALLWIYRPRRRPILWLDEPGRGLEAWRRERYARWLSTMAKGLGLQLIIVTHDQELIEIGDAVHHLSAGPDEVVKVKTEVRG